MRVAAVQMDVVFADKQANLAKIDNWLAQAAAAQAQLAVFPECAVTGYCYENLAEALPVAESLPGPSTAKLIRFCQRYTVHAVVGLLERSGEAVYNACVLVGPGGLLASYRKIHLPYLGVDRFTTPGDRPFAVHSCGDVRVGMNICYDGSFPESARVLALAGADLIVLPTNWPPGSQGVARHAIPTRALENKVYYVAANRVGHERGFDFVGQSQICGVHGQSLALAAHRDEALLVAELDIAQARDKRIARVPDAHVIDRFADRRPDMYGPIARTSTP